MNDVPVLRRNDIRVLEISNARNLSDREKDAWRRMGEQFGFFICELQGMADLRLQLYEEARVFFHSTDEEKAELGYQHVKQGPYGNVGYFSFGLETAQNENAPDPKEFFHVGPSDASLLRDPREYPSTPWPRSQPAFEQVSCRAYQLLAEAGTNILHSLCQAFSVNTVALDDMLAASNSILRIIRYPLSDVSPQVLAAQHVGIQLLGLQVAPSSGGLQYLLPNGKWVEPDYKDFQDCILVNIGEMGSHVLGGSVAPSPHRVLKPNDARFDRYSAVFFFHPDHRKPVTDLRAGVSTAGTTWGMWLNKRLKELRLTD